MPRALLHIVHPGLILQEELESRDMLIRTLARRMSVPVLQVTEIVEGRRHISPALARRLGAALGTGPRIWRSIQLALDRAIKKFPHDT